MSRIPPIRARQGHRDYIPCLATHTHTLAYMCKTHIVYAQEHLQECVQVLFTKYSNDGKLLLFESEIKTLVIWMLVGHLNGMCVGEVWERERARDA